MTFDTISVISLVLAGIPCGLFLLNLFVYRRLSSKDQSVDDGVGISVLIPARNEEQNIRATLEAVLANHGCEFDVIVLDDHSTDHTANMVGEFSRRDKRVRLESAPRLPVGWCGKQHACHVLAKLARYPLLIFIDADVRLAPDALVRISAFMNRSGVALASGVPLQELGSLSERLLIPQIHFILLGFLPMHLMRRTRIPGFSAGCGQLFVARRDAYEATGGHAMVHDSLHDGLKLPRLFRKAGFQTDLFDATDIAICRMYRTNAETWRGLGRNATEGLAAPTAILPMTILLLGGQVVPFICLLFVGFLSRQGIAISIIAAALALIPRIISSLQFRQPPGTTLLHPIGVMALLWIQWYALFRYLAGKPSTWKGRSYGPPTVVEPAKMI